MGTTRSNVSRFERRKLGRSKLAAIAAYVEALGGTLHLVADFCDRQIRVSSNPTTTQRLPPGQIPLGSRCRLSVRGAHDVTSRGRLHPAHHCRTTQGGIPRTTRVSTGYHPTVHQLCPHPT
jgi:hypothetical protein